MNPFNRLGATSRRLAAAPLAAFLVVALASEALASDPFALQISQNSRRTDAVALDGATVRRDANVAVFVELDSLANLHDIKRVKFSVNGKFVRSEYRYPFDLLGTRRSRRAALLPVRYLHTGANEIAAEVVLRSRPNVELSGTLNVLPGGDTIVGVAAGNPGFSLLVEAVMAADLVDALNARGPLTVFAPNNAAFVALLGDLGMSKDELFADKELLTTVLTYHVLGSGVFSPQVLAASELFPLQGEPIAVDADALTLNDANILATDLAASNGVIHVIDGVLLPPSITDPQPTIAEIAAGNPDFSILLEAVAEVGLDGVLSAPGTEFTVFAPTNAAFLNLLGALNLSKAELFANRSVLTTVLLYHIANEELFSGDVVAREQIRTLGSESIDVDAKALTLDDSNLIALDFDAVNGVVHVIDTVLVPEAALELLAP